MLKGPRENTDVCYKVFYHVVLCFHQNVHTHSIPSFLSSGCGVGDGVPELLLLLRSFSSALSGIVQQKLQLYHTHNNV